LQDQKSFLLLPLKFLSNEKNIPAIGQKAQEQARFQGEDVDQERSQGIGQQTRQGQEKTDRLRREQIV
jgi:hypothetical protein